MGRELFLVVSLLLTGAWGAQAESERDRAVEAFIQEMTAKHGFTRAELETAFAGTRSRPAIVELMDRAAKPTPWEDYRATFVNDEKLSAGVRFGRAHAEALELASERYGVPPEIILAVIGIETHYGRNTGRHKVLEALATLAFEYPRRARTFRLELEHFLLLAREEGVPLATATGSYAGAMGIAQFMPGSYRRYAIDFDGDGRRDLFDDPEDAIGSVANYLTAHGWRRDRPIAVPAKLSSEAAAESFQGSGLSTRYSLGELKILGVEADGAFDESARVMPLLLKNRNNVEYWLGFDNFYVITRYNHSAYYAMAVHQLARELREKLLLSAAEAP